MAAANLEHHLEKLEALVDLDHVARTRDLQRRAFRFESIGHIPTVINYPVAAEEWPDYSFLEIFDDPEKMLLQELRSVYAGAALQDDRLYGIRANYGTGIIASLFGCEIRTFPDSLPIALPVGRERVDPILDSGVPDLRAGIAGRALETVAFFRERLRPYPKLSQVVGSSLLDIQSAFDNASMIWGSSVFLAVYDEPEKLRRLMQLVTDTIFAVIVEHRRLDRGRLDQDDGAWNHLGGLCLRLDSCINLSGEHYVEFVEPFDAQLLGRCGGWIHFCGRAHQWWERLLDLPNLKGINPYQGEFYSLLDMYRKCEAARIPIVQWTQPLDARCRERIRTGFSRIMWVADAEAAKRARERLCRTGHADSD